MFKIVWYDGEYLDGWKVIEGAEELRRRGVASYMSGWGMVIDESVVEAILGYAPQHAGEIELPEAGIVHAEGLLAEAKAARKAREAQVEMIRCSCGHVVPKSQVMSASLGTCCPDCYDRMSDGY